MEVKMTQQTHLSRIMVAATVACILLGMAVGWALAEQPETSGSSPPGDGEAQDRPEVIGSQFYKRVTGYSFRPVHHAMTYVGVNSVCFYRSSDAGYNAFTHTLQLPDGAEVNQATFYYYDSSIVGAIQFSLVARDGFGGGPTVAAVQSQGSNGFGSVVSGPLSYVVDNFEEVLELRATIPDGIQTGLQICGALVSYQYNLNTIFLPEMLNQAMP
jgi:hypothetical protein